MIASTPSCSPISLFSPPNSQYRIWRVVLGCTVKRLGEGRGADVGKESAGYWVGNSGIGWKCCHCMGDCQGFVSYRPRYVIQLNPPKSFPLLLYQPLHLTQIPLITYIRTHIKSNALSPIRRTKIL